MRLLERFVAAPAYPPEPADLRTVTFFGLELPFRASVAIVVVTIAVLFDYSRTFIPEPIRALGLGAEGLRYQATRRRDTDCDSAIGGGGSGSSSSAARR
jgi:hypothetical protein